ncbi:hypothetical protein M8C21_019011 [Ambrosia artemisiifolia]|uniref:Uncharacterized protein n=1 Tax=Ambrosia artemisiifolia TaxID=4212 RepID=A0AAD5D7E5_AMBAR|nr:hypothetical protein M8C21_019011 [Ambrosia artemisiifolia]
MGWCMFSSRLNLKANGESHHQLKMVQQVMQWLRLLGARVVNKPRDNRVVFVACIFAGAGKKVVILVGDM